MFKKKRVIGIMLTLTFLILAFRVLAAGNGEGGDFTNTTTENTSIINNTNSDNNDTTNNNTNSDNNGTTNNNTNSDNNGTTNRTDTRVKDCSKLPSEMGRIRCRLKHGDGYIASPGEIPEACKLRTEEKRGRCVAFYNAIQKCYDNKKGKDKDLCFRKASGLQKKISEENVEGRKEKARNYMMTLLYELEERVEKFNAKGKITEEKSAEIISKIIEIKKSILEGETKETIRPELEELKQLWRSSINKQTETEVKNE